MIALLPTLTLPALTAALARDRFAEASTASRLEREVLGVAAMEPLREALTAEPTTAVVVGIAKRLGLPPSTISRQFGLQDSTPAEARAATDKALAAIPKVAALDDALGQIRTELSSLRADLAAATPESSLARLGSYAHLLDLATDAEQSLARRIGAGVEGTSSAHLLAKVRCFVAVSAVIISQERRLATFYPAVVIGSGSGFDAEELAWESKRYEVLRAQLDTELDQPTAQAWNRIVASEQYELFDAALAKGPNALPDLLSLINGAPLASSAETTMSTVRAMVSVKGQLSAILQQTARDAAAVARNEATSVQRRAAVFIAGVSLMAVMTVVVLFLVGGLLRKRLRGLAAGARRLSAGYLEPVAVHGPRELAATGEALNAAVASLHHIQVKSELLAAGDLSSPELEQSAPGPLGAAIDASVSRVVTAVREREELQLQLTHQASHDPLTGLPNRAELDRALVAALGRAERAAAPVSVLFVDLDEFKACNDRYGHAIGDHVLRTTADRLRQEVRPGDVVGRLGGDEFVVVVEGVSPGRETVRMSERILAAISRPIDHDGHRVAIGASIGLAGCDRGQATPSQLLFEADSAVYRAKASGRGCVVVHDSNLRTALHAQQTLETAIRHALEHDEFVLHYQPVVDLTTLRLCGLEALIRWQKPGTGLIMPGDFLPPIETTDLILDIDRWVLGAATTQLRQWSHDPALHELTMWVNISGRHLANRRVIEDVQGALTRSGLPAAQLGIEITEGVSIDNPQAVEHLTRLSVLGVRLALDDFGTGHTSISQLLRLPLNVLKLDRSLIDTPLDGSTGHGSPSISRHVIEMAHTLGLTVVAEGVESPEQLAALQTSNCDRAQGYLISRPLAPDLLYTWWASQSQPTSPQTSHPAG